MTFTKQIFNMVGDILFEAELDEKYKEAAEAVQRGEAVKIAVKQDVKLIGTDLSYAKLYEADLSYAILCDVNFTHANLSGTNFTGAMLADTDFTDANLIGANFTDAFLIGASFFWREFD